MSSYDVDVCCDIAKYRYQGAPQNNVSPGGNLLVTPLCVSVFFLWNRTVDKLK
jgi:hypothetical protein